MVAKFNCPAVIPAWLQGLPATALLNANDVSALFGFKNRKTPSGESSIGRFPRPDVHLGELRRAEWRAITIRNEIRRRAKLNAERAKP